MPDTNPIKFGTDGWRGVIGEDFTFDNVRICAQAVSDYLKQSNLADDGLIIGYDTRFASEDFAAAVAEVTAANGIIVFLCPEVAPTPVISYGTLVREAGGAVIITASHNPGKWNGFKFKTKDGAGAPDEVTAQIEYNISSILDSGQIKRIQLEEALEKGIVKYLDLEPFYCQQLAILVDLESLRQAKLKVIVDSMYGAGAGYIKKMLSGGSTEVLEINGERNPLFPGIQPEPIGPNLVKLSSVVTGQRADVGLATDGDADRLGVIDEKGRFITTLQVMTLLCLYLLEVRGERGTIVKTINTSSMVNRLAEMYDVPVKETPVGFKHVAPIMMAEKVLLGGEESGGYGFSGHAPERDGILAALYFLDLMVKTGRTPSQLIDYLYSKVGTHHYDRVDVRFPEEQRQSIIKRIEEGSPNDIGGAEVVKYETGDGYRFILADTSWLLIRFSGTEPLLRIYSESDSPERVEKLLGIGRELAGV